MAVVPCVCTGGASIHHAEVLPQAVERRDRGYDARMTTSPSDPLADPKIVPPGAPSLPNPIAPDEDPRSHPQTQPAPPPEDLLHTDERESASRTSAPG